MLYRFKRIVILLVSVLITFSLLWSLVKKFSPTVTPEISNPNVIERDHRGAINIDLK